MKNLKWNENIPKPKLEGGLIRLDKKQYLEALRLQLELDEDEFNRALGNLLKDKIVRFSDKTDMLLSVR